MKAIRVHQFGGADVMQLEDVPVPQPGEGQALVKLAAIGLNFIDNYQRSGQYKMSLPFTPGSEGAGTVEAVGPGVSEVAAGDRVAYAGVLGAYAEYAAVPASKLVKVPEGVSFAIAASVMLQGMTAHYLTHSTYPLKAGDAALLHAAAGGVGLLLTQVAKMLNATIIGTAGTPDKADLARSYGADHVILYREQDFEAEVKRLTDGQGVCVVYDSVGASTFDKSLNCLAPRGYMVLFGQSSGPVAPVNPQVLNAKGSLFLTRPSLVHYTRTREEMLSRADEVLGWAASGRLKVRIGQQFGLGEAAVAQKKQEARETTGKTILIP